MLTNTIHHSKRKFVEVDLLNSVVETPSTNVLASSLALTTLPQRADHQLASPLFNTRETNCLPK